MRSTPRFRFQLRQLMLVVLFCAVMLGVLAWVRAKRDAARARAMLAADVSRAEDRTAWAERMFAKGYVSKAQLALERQNLARLKLKMLQNGLAAH
jgi:hypothetical protein